MGQFCMCVCVFVIFGLVWSEEDGRWLIVNRIGEKMRSDGHRKAEL